MSKTSAPFTCNFLTFMPESTFCIPDDSMVVKSKSKFAFTSTSLSPEKMFVNLLFVSLNLADITLDFTMTPGRLFTYIKMSSSVTQMGRPLNVIRSFGGGLVFGKCLYNAMDTLSTSMVLISVSCDLAS